MNKLPASVIELIVLHPKLHRQFERADVLVRTKQRASDDDYAIYGVDPAWGAWAVLSPDRYVGVVVHLDDIVRVEEYLKRCIRMILVAESHSTH